MKTLIKPLGQNLTYQTMSPVKGHHLEVTVKVHSEQYYGKWRYEKFYFAEGTYTPDSVEFALESEFHFRAKYAECWYCYEVISHRTIPTWNGVFPELNGIEDYYVEAIIQESQWADAEYIHFPIEATAKDEIVDCVKELSDGYPFYILSVTPYVSLPRQEEDEEECQLADGEDF